ncbi:MAG TPA: DUF4157 domain-containing protein, partial [Ilumatobacteraceae bacterium]
MRQQSAYQDAEVTTMRVAEREPAAVSVGGVHDPAEHDADSMAERALELAGDYSPGTIRRATAGAAPDGLSVDHSSLRAAASGGQALDGSVRERLEPGLGADLGSVRVHTGAKASRLAADMGAAAFTHGNDMYFGAGKYQPGTASGDHLIAHEAAHTVQSGASGAVHRFPESALTMPQPWRASTGNVFRPGEGASGGVYILSPKVPGPIRKVVAKPVFPMNGMLESEDGAQLAMADQIITKVFGGKAPKSRVVKSGTPEFAELLAVCGPHQPGQPGEDQPG